ncbi:threonine/homoserine/homoserine lactone efflux protein [Cricetibacter osteomyelitidis]|uniref:Threonine/homoserine/homoserine lactone efflux protein n=1 Tax=Cricetibacter osteomyelitidis TaxID=1521931 RepID=A0A4R2TQM0_9PAST|nr:LysE family translocator [Cricetibacter osteomyelitidis]TCP97312.1 threonine/homoserine/homoserine lactone efflux protein [Cricetibacter osteomyelitidis]
MTTLMMGFWVLSFTLVLVPGADWAYLLTAGVAGKVRWALLGMLLGYLLVIFCVMTGIGALIAAEPLLLNGLTFLGAAYLLWLSWQVLKTPATVGENTAAQQTPRQWIAKGIAVSGLNPKVLLMFIALMPPFLSSQAALSIPVQILLLGLIHIANCALVYPLVAVGIGLTLRRRPQYARWITRFAGAAMLLLAVSLITENLLQYQMG